MEKRGVPLPPPLPSFVLRAFSSGVACVKYHSADACRLYTADQGGTVQLFNLRTRLPILTIDEAHTSTILDLKQLHAPEHQLVTFSKDGLVKIWNEHGQCQWNYQTHHCSFSNCDVTASNLIVVPVGNDRSIIAVLDSRSSDPLAKKFLPVEKETKQGMVMKLRIMDEAYLCAAYENGSVSVFDISTAKQIDTYQMTSDHEPITAMDVFNRTCLCGTTKSDLVSLDFDSMQFEPTPKFRTVEVPNAGTSFIRCRPDDGKLIAVAGWDWRIRLFRRETGKQLAMLDLHRQQVNSIDFSHHTQQMACASEDRTVSIWDIYNNTQQTQA